MQFTIYFTNNSWKQKQISREKKLTVTHNFVSWTFSDMEIIGPSCQIGHVEWHVELYRFQNSLLLYYRKELKESRKKERKKGLDKKKEGRFFTVSVRWSKLTEAKRRRSLQLNRRIVVIFLEPRCFLDVAGNFQRGQKWRRKRGSKAGKGRSNGTMPIAIHRALIEFFRLGRHNLHSLGHDTQETKMEDLLETSKEKL